MRKLVASTSVSLDGVMLAPKGQRKIPRLLFALGGWVFPAFPYWDETLDLTDLAERGVEEGSRDCARLKTYLIRLPTRRRR